jgi:hypothetical protein
VEEVVDVRVRQAFESLPDFAEWEVFALEAADEAEAGEMPFVVVGAGAAGCGCWEEALLDVVANGPRRDVGDVAELSEVEGLGGKHQGIVPV